MAAAFLPVIPAYWSFVDYSVGLDAGEWVVLMKRPKESATGSGLLAPFTFGVWILILASVICMAPVINSLIRTHYKLCKEDQPVIYGMGACSWFVFGALMKQGTTLSPYVGKYTCLR